MKDNLVELVQCGVAQVLIQHYLIKKTFKLKIETRDVKHREQKTLLDEAGIQEDMGFELIV